MEDVQGAAAARGLRTLKGSWAKNGQTSETCWPDLAQERRFTTFRPFLRAVGKSSRGKRARHKGIPR